MKLDNKINTIQNLSLASAIGMNEGFLSPEIVDQMQKLKPVAELMVQDAIIDYFGQPSYTKVPDTERRLNESATKVITNILKHPDEKKTELIASGLNREIARQQEEIRGQIALSGRDPDEFVTINNEDIDGLLSINPLAQGERSQPLKTAMNQVMALMWKNKLYDASQAQDYQKVVQDAYQEIHKEISKRLTVKTSCQLIALEKRKPTPEYSQREKVRAEKLFNDIVPQDFDKGIIYKRSLTAASILYMLAEVRNIDSDYEGNLKKALFPNQNETNLHDLLVAQIFSQERSEAKKLYDAASELSMEFINRDNLTKILETVNKPLPDNSDDPASTMEQTALQLVKLYKAPQD